MYAILYTPRGRKTSVEHDKSYKTLDKAREDAIMVALRSESMGKIKKNIKKTIPKEAIINKITDNSRYAVVCKEADADKDYEYDIVGVVVREPGILPYWILKGDRSMKKKELNWNGTIRRK